MRRNRKEVFQAKKKGISGWKETRFKILKIRSFPIFKKCEDCYLTYKIANDAKNVAKLQISQMLSGVFKNELVIKLKIAILDSSLQIIFYIIYQLILASQMVVKYLRT